VAPALTMYTTTWCAFCKRLKGQLAKAGIEIAEVNIEEDPAAADYVMSVNGGFQTVPTVVFSDGSALTNPSAAAVSQRLAELAGTDEPAVREPAQPAAVQPEVAQP
jgi:mycoredoxin